MRRSWLRMFWMGMLILAVAAGYLVSSGLGARLVHREIETQLGRFLGGPVSIKAVDVRIEDGLLVEAREITAFPSRLPQTGPAQANRPQPTHGRPALRSRRILAWIDLPALLIGRLEASTVVFEGPHARVEALPDGSFAGLPLAPMADPVSTGMGLPRIERLLLLLQSIDPISARIAADFRAADRIEIRDGTLEWIDGRMPDASGGFPTIRFELFQAIADRDWLSGNITIESEAVVVDGRHAPFPVQLTSERVADSAFTWQIDIDAVPATIAKAALGLGEIVSTMGGFLSARLVLDRESDGSPHLLVEAAVTDALIEMRQSGKRIERDRVEFETEIRLTPKFLQVREGRLAGTNIRIDFMGQVSRPLTSRSIARIETRTSGVEFEDLRALAGPIESESENAFTFMRLTDRVRQGKILYVQAAGRAPIDYWQEILEGRQLALPKGFLLGGAFDEIDVGDGPDDLIEDLEGRVEWVGDQLSFRETTATYRGTRLPKLNVVFSGVQHIVQNLDRVGLLGPAPPQIPGVLPLAEIIKPRDPNSLPPVKAVGLAIDRLDHPIFRLPLRNLRVFVEPLRRGVQLNVREGTWGGASVTGELVWFDDEEAPTISAHMKLGPPAPLPTESSPAPVDGQDIASRAPSDRWGEGRFEVEFRPRPWLPFKTADGFFRIEGDRLIGNELELATMPEGTLAARMALQLDDPDSVGLDLSFALTDGRLEGISSFIALPEDLATGQIGAAGSLMGRIAPDRNFIEKLEGRIRADAQQGRIRMGLPLMLRLTKATEGYNPFANEDELRYERMAATIDFDQGVISTENFEIEGPLRVFASAEIDTLPERTQIRAVVGIFLFRGPNQVLGSLPLVRYFLPGSERGLIGTWMEVDGPLAEPEVDALAMKTLMSIVPSAIKAPFQILGYLFDRDEEEE